MARFLDIALAVAALCVTSQIAADEPANASLEAANDTPIIVPANCTNGRRMAGSCVERMQCIYNTENIDLTLYGPPSYSNPCPGEFMCCPDQFIIPKAVSPPSSTTESDEGFDFGDSEEDDF